MGSDDMSDNNIGRHAKARPTGTTALRSAAAQAAGKKRSAERTPKGGRTLAAKQSGKGRASAIKLPMKKARPKKARKPINSDNVKTALWLWCFPVGLSRMWRKGCTWPRGVKIGVTAAMAAVLVAIFAVPTPTADRYTTGVQMVADTPEVEVYGPALPTLIVQGYTRENTGSIIVDEVSSDVHYVYAADDADCYHEYECKFAFASSQRLTVYEAYHLGFKPCGRCNPPVYIPGETDPITAQPLSSLNAAQEETEAGEAES